MENNASLQISPHALARFKERWKILKGKPLEEGDVLPKLQGLILKSEPEPDSPALLKRRERYGGGEHRYMISGPWRLVWYNNCLMTIELRHLGVFSKPKLYPGEARASFFLRVTEENDFTLVEKSVLKDFISGAKTMVFSDKPEVNAIIRFLRLIGADIVYKRTGKEIKKQAIIDIILPKELRKFEITELENRKIGLSILDQGRPYNIVGITHGACLKILNFLIDQEWLDCISLVRKAVLSEQEKRAQAKIQRMEQHEINLGKKAEKIRIKELRLKTGAPRTRVKHYS